MRFELPRLAGVPTGRCSTIQERPFGTAAKRIAAAAMAAMVLIGGCSTARVHDPLTKTLGGSTPEAQGEFWYQLAKRPIASNDEAFHALLLYVDSKDANPDYASRVNDLKSRRMLPRNFSGGADEAVDRGTLAVALDQMLHVRGGVTMRVFGSSPRYALRAAEERGLFPPSSPNQGITGGEFVGVMQKAEEFQHGNPSEGPAALLPDQIHPVTMNDAEPESDPASLAVMKLDQQPTPPVYLDDVAATAPAGPATAPTTQPIHLRAIVTGTQGDLVEIRSGPNADWKRARLGMVLHEGAEIRTGPNSAIRFLIPKEEAFCLDSEGSITLEQAILSGNNCKTRVDLDRGRLREDLTHNAPVQIEEAGIEHDTVIKSPHSALALRGTKVSLFEQASFDPIAVSLSGQATFTNTDGLRIPFGGRTHVVIVGNQTSPADQADARASGVGSGSVALLAFETRELAIVSQRGGFQRGDVIVGNLSINDFYTGPHGELQLPGALDFVLQWPAPGQTEKNLVDLNLAVFSPPSPESPNGDHVANPPFIYSLNPNSPMTKAKEATLYPQTSASGGHISTNSVGPDGLELASWPKTYPVGTYRIAVYDLVDALVTPGKPLPPLYGTSPVSFTINAYLNNQELTTQYNGTIGLLQTIKYLTFNIPASPAGAAVQTGTLKGKAISPVSVTVVRPH